MQWLVPGGRQSDAEMKPTATFLATFVAAFASVLVAGGSVNAQSAVEIDYDTDDNRLIEISNLDQLYAIRFDLNGNGSADRREDEADYLLAFPSQASGLGCRHGCAGYELAQDLDFNDTISYASGSVDRGWSKGENGEGWDPIGVRSESFICIFHGNDHTIANLFISRGEAGSVGLFGHVGIGGFIHRVGVIDAEVSGGRGVGALAGGNEGTIVGSYATGRTSGSRGLIGGLVGSNDRDMGRIVNSYAATDVSADNNGGGLVGGNWGTIIRSSASGNVSGRFGMGGLAGVNNGPIIASHATGEVSGDQTAGGLVANNNSGGRIIASYARGFVSGYSRVGGLVGENYETIMASYATGGVNGSSTVGGLVGGHFGEAMIIASYATGAVSGGSRIGGLVGYHKDESTIIASYATGPVSGRSGVGGLVGWNDEPNGIIASYWDVETSGQPYGVGTGFTSGSQAKTTAELHSATSYAGIYVDWNMDIDNADGDDDETTGRDDPWDFGSASQYPALKVDFDGDRMSSWHEFGDQPRVRLGPVFPYTTTSPFPTSPSSLTPVSIVDYDTDGDGLIEVSSLEQLDAIRYDLDGNGQADHPRHTAQYAGGFPGLDSTSGCPDTGCVGYELNRDLDFADPSSYAFGAVDRGWSKGERRDGWLPVGMNASGFVHPFLGAFDGNGHTIASLFVDTNSSGGGSYHVGLFGFVGRTGVIRSVGLVDASVEGRNEVGGLVGRNWGTITGSHVTGEVSGNETVGGLAGNLTGIITSSYAEVKVSGREQVGGLVGNNSGAIRASYAVGDVSGSKRVGGLAGVNNGGATIRAAYAATRVSGDACVGGLVGTEFGVYGASPDEDVSKMLRSCVRKRDEFKREEPQISASYWDIEKTDHERAAHEKNIPGSVGKTTAQLQWPRGYTGIYRTWNIDIDDADGDGDETTGVDDPWDFGTPNQYPTLSVALGGATMTLDESVPLAAGGFVLTGCLVDDLGSWFDRC